MFHPYMTAITLDQLRNMCRIAIRGMTPADKEAYLAKVKARITGDVHSQPLYLEPVEEEGVTTAYQVHNGSCVILEVDWDDAGVRDYCDSIIMEELHS